MEQKTDLSREFGLLPDRRQQEFGSDPAALDPKTDPSPEFSHPPDAEFGEAQTQQEFAHNSDSDGTAKKPSRRERHRRTLLLQMAAVGLSAVVVTSSFGQDILGEDKLFSNSDHSSESHISQIVVEEVDEASKHDDDDDLYTTSYLIYGDGDSDPGPYADSVRYDERNNVLYLDEGPLDILRIDNMGADFTIYLEDNCHIGLIECFGGSLTITGNPGTSLLVNQHDEYVNWWHGIILYGNGTNAALTISPGVTVDVVGHGAIAIDNTTASPGIRFNPSYTSVSGTVQSGSYIFRDGIFVDEGGAADWTVVDERGNEAEHVVFSSGPYAPAPDTPVFPEPGESTPPFQPVDPGTSDIPRLTVTTTDQTVYTLWLNGERLDGIPSVAPYDPSSNTLYIGDAPLLAIEAISMGSDFTIHVMQNVSVGSISSVGCNIILSGENTTLAVNEDMANLYGIHLDAAGGNCYLQIEPGISILTVGQEAGLAIANSWAAPGIVYDPSLTYIYEPVMTGDYLFPSRESKSGNTQDTTVIDEKDPFQGPSTHVYIQGSYIELEPKPPVEEPLLSEYSSLYITSPGSITPVYIVENGQVTESAGQIGGLSYDINTNTLTLNNYVGGDISGTLMGENFTIYLKGTNEVKAIYGQGNSSIGPSSLSLIGDVGASLTVNADNSEMTGIWLTADNTESILSIGENIDVFVSGIYSAIQVDTTLASRAIRTADSTQIYGGFITSWLDAGPLNPDAMDWGFSYLEAVSTQIAFYGTRSSSANLFVTLDNGLTPIYLVENGKLAENTVLPDGLAYNFLTNTLTLTDFIGYTLESNGMQELTIDLFGENHIEWINSADTLIFNGDPYAVLTVNESQQFIQGISITANGEDRHLQVNWGPEIRVYGSTAAVVVDDTTSSNGIWLGTNVIHSDRKAFGTFDGSEPIVGHRDWTVLADGVPSTYVVFSRDYAYGPSEQGTLSITMDGVTTILFENGRPTAQGAALSGVTYLYAANTLVLDQVTFDSISATYMGEGFAIDLCGENHGKTITVTGSGNAADGSLYISGEHPENYGHLYLTADSEPYGILLEANGGSSILSFGWTDEVLITAAESAVMVRNTTASPGIGDFGSMFFGEIVSTPGEVGANWNLLDYQSENSSTSLRLNGGFGDGPDYVIINGISVWDLPSYDAQRWISANYHQTVYMESPNENDTSEPVEGMVYDETSNTLTLTNCTARSLEAILMGDDFTIHLVGENHLDELLLNVCSVTFTGNGTLTVNGNQLSYSRGIYLDAQNRNHFMRVTDGVTLRIHDTVLIHATTAEQALILSPGVSASSLLAKDFVHTYYYGVSTDFDAGSANYSFVDAAQAGGSFTEFVYSPYVEITSN